MDQKKTGRFLKELRKEKGITQEQLAEVFGVAGRTVSRWETGSNMPDLDILIRLADYYEVEIREILYGERREQKGENMNEENTVKKSKEVEEAVLQAADYSNKEKQSLAKRMCFLFTCGFAAFTIYLVMVYLGLENTPGIQEDLASAALGFSYGIMLCGVLYTSGRLAKFKEAKRRFKIQLMDK